MGVVLPMMFTCTKIDSSSWTCLRECVLVPNVSGCPDSNCPDRTLLLSVKLPFEDILNRMCLMSMLQFP